jgi:hypothetical protein
MIRLKSAGYGEAPLAGNVTPIDPLPFFVKKFLYRTRNALQSEMIIPRSPSPQPLEERAEEDLTPEEMRELIRRQKVSFEILRYSWLTTIGKTGCQTRGEICQAQARAILIARPTYPSSQEHSQSRWQEDLPSGL